MREELTRTLYPFTPRLIRRIARQRFKSRTDLFHHASQRFRVPKSPSPFRDSDLDIEIEINQKEVRVNFWIHFRVRGGDMDIPSRERHQKPECRTEERT